MTETIKTVLFNYAVCALLGGVLEYIAPSKAKKVLRVSVVSVMLLVVASPVVNNEISFENIPVQEDISESVNYDAMMHTAKLAEQKIRTEIKEILINESIDEYEIYITTTIDEAENTVYLDEVKIEVGNAFEGKLNNVKSKIPEEYQKVLKIGVKNE